jgi:flagellar hook-basal body complex protein FliE
MTPITGISSAPILQPGRASGAAGAAGAGAASGPSFKDFLVQSIQDVNSMQAAADKAVEKLATGGDVNPAEVLTAVQKADIAFQMMIQVRNKLVDAFTEIKSIQI